MYFFQFEAETMSKLCPYIGCKSLHCINFNFAKLRLKPGGGSRQSATDSINQQKPAAEGNLVSLPGHLNPELIAF